MKALAWPGLFLLAGVLCMLVLFVPAGRLDWTPGWIYVALLLGGGTIMSLVLVRSDPDLMDRRLHVGKGTKRWDRVMVPLLKLGFTAVLLVAAFDAGPRDRSPMATGYWPLGFVLHVAGFALFTWAMLVNPHFESTVRIQTDRDHVVIDRGPYRFVRHPGYVASALLLAAVPFLLGSWWAFVPSAATMLLLTVRTALEDRLLQSDLEGYADYAARVRYRLIPGIW